jgi:hypothetical protein
MAKLDENLQRMERSPDATARAMQSLSRRATQDVQRSIRLRTRTARLIRADRFFRDAQN